MELIQQFISEDIIYALGWTVMHSLWQAFAIAIILALVLNALRSNSATIRYEASAFALFLVLVSAVSTFIWYYAAAGQETVFITEHVLANEVMVGASEPLALSNFAQMCVNYFNTHLPIIVMIWLVGVAFFVLRLLGGLVYVNRLKHYRTQAIPAKWQNRLALITKRIPVKKTITILESAVIQVPMVIGYFKPYILMPIGAINQLAADEVEAVIAHEVAHIYRNDFLMNIIISFIEVFFYYNPAVWWISGNIRLERENCCDDIAIKVCGNSLSYAKALVRLQELNAYAPSFAMPFSGQRNQLLYRIRRILNQPQNRHNILERLMATLVLLFAVVFMSVHQNTLPATSQDWITEGKESFELEVPLEADMESEFKKYKVVEVIVESDGETLKPIIVEAKEEGENEELMELEVDDRFIVENRINANVIEEERIFVRSIPENEFFFSTTPQSFVSIVYQDTLPEKSLSKSNRLRGKIYTGKQQYITKMKNEDGQMVIVIAGDNADDIEIVVDEDTDRVIINGAALADGDTTVITKTISPNTFWLSNTEGSKLPPDTFRFEHHHTSAFYEAEKTLAQKQLEMAERQHELQRAYGLQSRVLKEEQKQAFGEAKRTLKQQQHQEQFEKRLAQQKLELEASILKEKESLAQLHWETEELARVHGLVTKDERKIPEAIAKQLKADGLIKSENNFKYSLSHKRFKVNGKKQSSAIHKRYLELHAKWYGAPLDRESKYEITFSKD